MHAVARRRASVESGGRPGPSTLRWIAALGATGFACGFFGPIALAPDANQGPLLGIFITGPGGVLLGLVLGLLTRLLPLSARQRWRALVAACALVAVMTLVASTPEPASRGEILEAEVTGCTSPAAHADAAIHSWEEQIDRVTWAAPRPGWKQDAERRLLGDPGLVLDVHVLRARRVYENRKPWNRGTVAARPWTASDESKQYYGAGRCEAYLRSGRGFYHPTSATDASWPPLVVANFLGLEELGPVPPALRELTLD
jgi:hypothetical protein